ALLTVFTAWLSFRVRRLRPLLEGEPVVIVADCDVLVRNLRRQRMTVEEVEAEARQQQIASLDDVRFAVLETNGRISFATRGAEGGRRPQGRQDDGEQELDAPARRTERPVGRVRRGGKYARCGGPDPSTRRGSDARRGRHAGRATFRPARGRARERVPGDRRTRAARGRTRARGGVRRRRGGRHAPRSRGPERVRAGVCAHGDAREMAGEPR